jgi:hypothetical protein
MIALRHQIAMLKRTGSHRPELSSFWSQCCTYDTRL